MELGSKASGPGGDCNRLVASLDEVLSANRVVLIYLVYVGVLTLQLLHTQSF